MAKTEPWSGTPTRPSAVAPRRSFDDDPNARVRSANVFAAWMLALLAGCSTAADDNETAVADSDDRSSDGSGSSDAEEGASDERGAGTENTTGDVTGTSSTGGDRTDGGTRATTGGADSGDVEGTSGTSQSPGESTAGGADTQAETQDESAGTSGDESGPGSAGATIVPDPSWSCGMPEGIAVPESGALVFEATLEIGRVMDVGETQFGNRRVYDVSGGSVTGSQVTASVLEGGLDFELILANDAVELEQVLVLRANDGTLVYVRSCGVSPSSAEPGRMVFDFEAPNSSSLSWLNTGTFVATRTLDEARSTMTLSVFNVADIVPSEPRITLTDPPGVPQQSWECATASGQRGAMVFSENVTLGSSLAVGESKRGNRNIIPITGGTVSGQFAGSVVPGGADYQLIGGTTTLDARYTLESNDGEFLVVRNCGPFGALVPTFEARAEGPYAFLNANTFLSSDPGVGGGGVSITFYERN